MAIIKAFKGYRPKVGLEKLRAMLQSVTWEVTKPTELTKTI